MSVQLHTYVEARLNRWRAWYLAGRRPGPERVISSWGPLILDRNVGGGDAAVKPVKVDPTEAIQTDKAVDALAYDLRCAVHEVYLKGGTVEQKARSLGCHRDTVYDRISRANTKLLGYFNDQAAGISLPAPDRALKKSLTHSDKKPKILATVA